MPAGTPYGGNPTMARGNILPVPEPLPFRQHFCLMGPAAVVINDGCRTHMPLFERL